MTPLRLRINPSQADDLAVACRIGALRLDAVTDAIRSEKATILRERLSGIIERVVEQDDGRVLTRLLLGLAASTSRDTDRITGVLDGVTAALAANFAEDNRFEAWADCRSSIEKLLLTHSVIFSAKALNVSYDFERVLHEARIITSVRPIFTDERDEIVGATIVQTLRLDYFSNPGEQQSVSIAVDLRDVSELRKICDEAINKANLAKEKVINQWHLDALVPGDIAE